MKHSRRGKLHSIIGDATAWTDDLWSNALTYLRHNTKTSDALSMANAVGIEVALSGSKLDHLRSFRQHPPAVLLTAFDLMRKRKRAGTQPDPDTAPEPVTVNSLIHIDEASRPPAAPREHIQAIVRWCTRRRVASSEGYFPVEAQVRGNTVTIIEHYPDSRTSEDGVSVPIDVAQLRYRDGVWRLYWPVSELAWNLYQRVPAAPTPEQALDGLERDPFFWS